MSGLLQPGEQPKTAAQLAAADQNMALTRELVNGLVAYAAEHSGADRRELFTAIALRATDLVTSDWVREGRELPMALGLCAAAVLRIHESGSSG